MRQFQLEDASPKEIRMVKDIFKRVYRADNINEFFLNDMEGIKEFRKIVEQMTYEGINKPLAKKALVDYLDDIVKRLEKDVDVYEIE